MTLQIDGITYYTATASDGWTTGPCPSVAICSERLAAYEAGEEVSEAAPEQFSRAQLATARYEIQRRPRTVLIAQMDQAIQDALRNGLHSDAWIRATRLLLENSPYFTDRTWHAGGYRVRKGPHGPLVIEKVKASLSRG
jgi:hypothetical protein